MRTNPLQLLGASRAIWRLRAAYIASEINEAVACVGLFILGNCNAQNTLDPSGVLELTGIKAESAAYSYTVSISHDSGDAEDVAEEKICDLSAYARKLTKLFYVAGQFSAVFVTKLDASRLDRRRLRAVKSAGTNDGFNAFKRRVGKRCQRGILLKKLPAYDINSCIRALRGESAHNHQAPGLFPSPIE